MKHRVKKVLQSLLGIDRYLFLFAIIKIFTLRWDRLEGEFMRFLALVPDRGIVLDVGANIGIMTVLLARKARKGTLYVFEPMPLNFKTLERVVAAFRLKNVVAHPWALGNENTTLEMVMPVVDSVRLQGLSHVVRETIQDSNEGEYITVLCKRLDDMDVFFAPGKRVAAIKIDVQDFEYFVFDGARKLLTLHRPIIYCELGNNENRKKCLELFDALNYDVKVLERSELQDFDPQLHQWRWNFFISMRQV
ncbi:MAG: FkbM family methyltransferase [Aggregatilineales bacterium]